ncbi:MAG: folylpolyglutamate synthase/dihydrofolate synthase family protein [Pseudomonadota bacterium]
MDSATALDEVTHPNAAVQEALQRLYAMQRKSVGQRLHGTAYETLLDHLGRPQDKLPPVIHLAGTNGKGSTTALLRAIYAAAGYTVHAYTSPHIFIFNERICLNGASISDDLLLQTIARVDAVLARMDDTVSFFEYITAMALLLFSERPADICLLETGMGGRLDPTNIVTHKAVTILTKISFDHMRFLGNTLPEIAAEKAGIMRGGTPCVVAPQYAPDAVLPVFHQIADDIGAVLHCAGTDWRVEGTSDTEMVFHWSGGRMILPRPSLNGDHQLENAGNAVMATQLLQSIRHVPNTALKAGLRQATWPARLQRVDNPALIPILPGVKLWYDGAHNDTGAQAMATQCRQWQDQGLHVHVIIALGAGKNAGDFVAPFLPHIASLQFLDLPVGRAPRSGADMLAEYKGNAVPASFAATPADALTALASWINHSGGGQRHCVLFCGSLYFAARVLV